MRKGVVIVAIAGAAGAAAVGMLATRSSPPDQGARTVAAKVDVAPEPPRITSELPSERRPVGTVVGGDSALNGDPVPERPRGAGTDVAQPRDGAEPEDDRREGRRGRDRGGMFRERMSPEDFAERYEERRERWQTFRDRYDTDGDGEFSEAEREAMREDMRKRWRERALERMTERFDADGDGVLSEEERIEAEAEMEARRVEWRTRMTERFDTDGDGQLSEAEQQAARERFRDRRGDGGSERDGRNGWRQMIEQYDHDGDGELNLDESYEAYLDRFDSVERSRFVRRYDEDGDGGVGAKDFEAFLNRYRSQEADADVNGDGVINQLDVDRFRDMMMIQP